MKRGIVGLSRNKGARVVFVLLLALTLSLGMMVGQAELGGNEAQAETTKTVVITADPAYIVITQTVAAWTLNDIVGDGVTPKGYIAPNTIYYANPLGDELAPAEVDGIILETECYFDLVTTGSSLHLDLTVNCGAFTTGGADMTNSDDGANGAATYGAYAWAEGGNYTVVSAGNKTIMKATGSLAMKEDLTPSASFHWGAQIETRENIWAASGASVADMVLTATAHPD